MHKENNIELIVLENIKPDWRLESMVAQSALRYVGHVVRQERGMYNDVMLGETSGTRRRGRPITRWLDKLNNITGPSINGMRWDARDRAKWRSATAVVARGRTRLDGTRWQHLQFVVLLDATGGSMSTEVAVLKVNEGLPDEVVRRDDVIIHDLDPEERIHGEDGLQLEQSVPKKKVYLKFSRNAIEFCWISTDFASIVSFQLFTWEDMLVSTVEQ